MQLENIKDYAREHDMHIPSMIDTEISEVDKAIDIVEKAIDILKDHND